MNGPYLLDPPPEDSKNDAAPAATRASVSNQKIHHQYKQESLLPPAHHSAPKGTSEVAAEMIKPLSRSRRELVFNVIKDAGSNGLTDEEGAAATGLSAQSYTPRRNELVKLGSVVDTGRRRRTRSGRRAAVWMLSTLAQPPGGALS